MKLVSKVTCWRALATFEMYFYRLEKLADRNYVKFKGKCEVWHCKRVTPWSRTL